MDHATPGLASYKKLKRDSNLYVNWLAQASKRLGFVSPVEDQPAQKTGRLKGRERAKAKQKASEADKKPTLEPRKYKISSKEIWERAAYLAEKASAIYMSEKVLRAVKRAIIAREDALAKAKQRPERDEESERGHEAFVKLLKNTVEILAPHISHRVRPLPVTAVKAPIENDEKFMSMFENLTVEDIEEEEEQTKVPTGALDPLHKVTDQPTSNDEFELDTSARDDIRLQWFCLYEDADKLLGTIKDIAGRAWSGDIDWATATLEVEAILESLTMEFKNLCETSSKIDIPPVSYPHDSTWTKSKYTLSCISEYRNKRKRYLISLLPLDQRSQHVPHSQKDIDNDQLMVQLMMDLGLELAVRPDWENLHQAQTLNGLSEILSPASLDSISRALDTVVEGHDVDFPAVMAAGIIHSMQPPTTSDPRVPYSRLISFQNFTRKIREDSDQAGSKLISVDPKVRGYYSMVLGRIDTLVQWVAVWPFWEMKYAMLKMLGQTQNGRAHELAGIHHKILDTLPLADEDKERLRLKYSSIQADDGTEELRAKFLQTCIPFPDDHYFLRTKNPLVSGKLMMYHYVLNEDYSLAFANSSPELFSMGHLLNAGLKMKQLTKFTNNFDMVLRKQAKVMFRGARPSDPESIMTRFHLASGIPLSKMVATHKGTNDARKIVSNWPKNIVGNPEARNFVPSPISQILREYFYGKESYIRTIYRLDKELQQEPFAQSPKSYIENLGIGAFVEKLEFVLPQVWADMAFDYVTLTQECSKLFHEIDMELAEQDLVGGVPPANPAASRAAGRGYILTDLLLKELFAASVKQARSRNTVATPKFDLAMKILNRYLESHT